MIVNNSTFNLSNEWRRWRGQKLKLLVLLTGFALLATLLAVSLRIGDLLFDEPPHWTNAQGLIYTLGKQQQNGRLSGVNMLTIDAIKKADGVRQVSWLFNKQITFTYHNDSLPELNTLMFEPEIVTMLGLDFPSTSNELQQGAWLSERFWREQLNAEPNVVGQFLQHKRIPQGVIIKGILPASLNYIGPWQPDVWLPKSYLRYQTVFSADSDPAVIDRFTRAIPDYYGVIVADKLLDIDAIITQLNATDLTVKGMSFRSGKSTLALLEGLYIDLTAYNKLVDLWRLLLLLIIVFGGILSVNTFSTFVSRAIFFYQDFRTLRVLGASSADLFRSAVMALLIKLLFVFILSVLFLLLISGFVEANDAYKIIAGEQPLKVSMIQLFAAWVITSAVLFTCCLFPLFNINKQALFTRTVNTNANRGQKFLGQMILVTQLIVALIATNLTLTLIVEQWSNYQNANVNLTVKSVEVQHRDSGLNLHKLLAGQVGAVKSNEIAIASNRFDQLNIEKLTDHRLLEDSNFAFNYVSANYFELLGIPSIVMPKNWQSGVILNETAAKMLSPNQTIHALLGSEITVGLMNGSQAIVGIVKDAPHAGRSKSAIPVIYLPILNDNGFTFNRYSFHFLAKHQQKIIPMLTTWLKSELSGQELSNVEPIESLIAKFDQHNKHLLISAIFIVSVILLGIFVSMWYQIRARLALEKQEFGILLAIGAPEHSLLLRLASQSLLALLIAAPLALMAQWSLIPLINESRQFVFNEQLFFVSALVIGTLVLITSILPLLALLKLNITSILRHD